MAFNALNCPAVSQLLTQVQMDFGIQESLVVKYLGSPPPSALPMPSFVAPSAPVAAPPAPEKKKRQVKEKAEGEQCTAVTAKGQCKFAVKCDGLCGIHLRKKEKESGAGPSEPKAPKVPKTPKAKKAEAPKHSHPLTEEAETCVVCETQGNVMKPEMTKADFEAVAEDGKSIQERLAAILAGSDEDEEDEEPTEPEILEEPEPAEEEEEEAEVVSLRAKLAKMVAEEDEVEEEEVDVEQMCETPPSQAKLSALMDKLSMAEGKEEPYNFDQLELEMEDEE
jgi:hypothetical protein